MKNLLLLLLFTLSLHSLEAQVCTGNTPIQNLANGMNYTINVGTAGAVNVTVTVVDNPVGLVGFLGGPGNPISFPDATGTFTYNLTGQTAPYDLDIYFNWTAGGQGNSTTVSCPAPAPPPALPITFEDPSTVTDYNLRAFGGFADGAAGDVVAALATDPTDLTNTVLSVTKDPAAHCWGGAVVADAGLANPIPFASNRLKMTVDVYSPEVGATILFKIEQNGTPTISSEISVNTTVANAWETITFDFANGAPAVNLNQVYDKVVVFPQFCGSTAPLSASPFYFDNIELLPAFGPLLVAPSLPITFGDPNTVYNLRAFGGFADGAAGDVTTTFATDPTDPTNTVLSVTKDPAAHCWGGTVIADAGLASQIPFAAGQTEMRLEVYSPIAGSTILLKVEQNGAPWISTEVVAVTTVANAWETLIFDFANGAPPVDLNQVYDKIVIFPQFCGSAVSSNQPYFFDNFRMTTQPFLECRQPTSTINTLDMCMAENLAVLPPFILNPDMIAGSVLTDNYNSGDYPIGTTVVTYTLTNANGTTSSCNQEVIITDAQPAEIGPCNTIIAFIDQNTCLAEVNVNPVITDNCGVGTTEGVGTFYLATGLYNHPITAIDAGGNATVHNLTIEVHDDQGPEFNFCPTEQIVLNNSTFPSGLMPTASDNCGMNGMTNNIPADGLPDGESTVTFTAEDTYGNVEHCVINVMVPGELISLHPTSDIGATLAEDENSQIVTWNPLNATTQCSYCEETSLEGFTFIGNYWGHQYFLADEVSLTRQDAQLIAEGYDAHLAVISTAGENNYLKEALSNEVRTAWIGLMPQNVNDTWSFVWDNDEANVFDALDLDMNEVNANTRIVLSQDGDWVDATDTEEKYFLIERPCVDFTQVGPYAPNTNQLLRSGDAWAEGDYEVTYAAVDMCGNESQLSFDVTVQAEVSEFCTTTGTDNSIWIEGITFHEMTSNTASNEGYANLAEEVTTMNIGDGTILLDLTAGGNTTDEVLYWRVWLDKNNDGDFFDAGEVLFEQSTENAHLQTNITLAQEAVTNARLRVAVARHAFPAPCGNPYVGEVEDYTVTLTVPAVIDIEREREMEIFPNPADTYVNVDLSDFAGEEVSIRVINNLGKSVSFTKAIVAIKGNVRLNLQGITGGMYNISVSTSECQITKRLVVSNVKRAVTAR